MVNPADTKFKVSKAFKKSIKIIPKATETDERKNFKNKFRVKIKAKNKGRKNDSS